jgi:hypothetical protein
MTKEPTGAEGQNMDEKELEEQLKAFQLSQQVYLEQTFKWLIDFVSSYFPEDELAIRDIEGGKPLGALVYRFRKFPNKKEYFEEMGEDYREGLELPEVLFVDSETAKFEVPTTLEVEDNFLEIPPDKLTGKMKDLREDLKRRAKVRQLRDSL